MCKMPNYSVWIIFKAKLNLKFYALFLNELFTVCVVKWDYDLFFSKTARSIIARIYIQ